MKNTIQLFIDNEKKVKGYPITSPDRVIDDNGVSIKKRLQNNVKFDIVGDGEEVPEIDGKYDDSDLVERIDNITERMDNIVLIAKTDKDKDDDTEILKKMINKAMETGTKLVIKDVFNIKSFLEIPRDLIIEFNGGYFNVGDFDITTQNGGWVYFNNPKYSVLPEWFGAKGDGISDDTNPCQKCIDSGLNPNIFPIGKTQAEAGIHHRAYNNICFDFNNTYKISSNLKIRAEYHFNKCVILSSDLKGMISGYIDDNNCVDKAIVIEKPDNYPSGDVDYQTKKHIQDLSFSYFNRAIENNGCDLECRIKDNNFKAIKESSIYLRECDGVLVEGNYGSWVYGYLVETYYSNACRITSNHVGETTKLGSKGIKINSGSGAGNLIEGNYLRECGVTILNRNNNVDKIVNNTFYNADVVISIDDNSRAVDINNNTFKSCKNCVVLYKEHILNNNTFINCDTPVTLKNTGNYNKITGNIFKKCRIGIKHGTSQCNQVNSNYFINIEGAAIDSDNFGYNMYLSDNNFINCAVVHNFKPTETQNGAKFAYNYSTQKGFVLGAELN